MPITRSLINALWICSMMESYSAIKMNELASTTSINMNYFKTVTLIEKIKLQKYTESMTPFYTFIDI